jgi:hypothetical protein
MPPYSQFFTDKINGNGSMGDNNFLVVTVISEPVFRFFRISENVFEPAPKTVIRFF